MLKKLPAVAFAMARSIAGDQTARRRALFRMTLAACVALFLGATLFSAFLDQHRWLFVLYWLAVAWLTLTIVLVAVYDVLAVLAEGRRARRELEHRLLEEQKLSTKSRRSNTSPDP
jgi:membrane protein implicated in regulation of membrane protease activity